MPLELDDLAEPAALFDAGGRIESCNQSWRQRCSRRNLLRQLADLNDGRAFSTVLSELLAGSRDHCSGELVWPVLGRVRARACRTRRKPTLYLLRLDEVPGQLVSEGLRALLDRVADGILLLDPTDGRTVYANTGLSTLLELENAAGLCESSRYGSMFAEQQLLPLYRRLQVTGALALDSLRSNPSGRSFPIRTLVMSLGTHSQPLLGVWLRELSEAERQVRLFQATNSRLQTIMQTSPVALVTLTNEGLVSSWNPAAERIYGWSREEVVSHPSPFAQELEPEVLRQMLLENSSLNLRLKRRCKNGALVDVSLSICPLLDGTGILQGLLEVGEDITDQVNADRLAGNLRVSEGREAERLSLAREIHDGPLQDLLVLGLSLGQAVPGASQAALRTFQTSVTAVSRELRSVLSRLRPAGLDELGLIGCLEALVKRLAADHGQAPATCLMLDEITGLNPLVQLSLLRIVQEAYQNCLRHAEASSVEISLRKVGDQAELLVVDDGRGFSPSEAEPGSEHYGLLGVQERVTLCGGTYQLDSRPGRGTRLSVRLPLAV